MYNESRDKIISVRVNEKLYEEFKSLKPSYYNVGNLLDKALKMYIQNVKIRIKNENI